jgi:hypothetical protein
MAVMSLLFTLSSVSGTPPLKKQPGKDSLREVRPGYHWLGECRLG